MSSDQIKLHLGCAEKSLPGYINVDISPLVHADLIASIDNLPCEACSVDMIYASHVLEHFGRHEVLLVLGEWFRVLKPQGLLYLAVPDFQAIMKRYLDEGNIDELLGLVCGGQRDDYDFHKMIFDEHSLERLLRDVGFIDIKHWNWRDTDHAHIDDYSQAYLPHMNKEDGRLMSLNMCATKTKTAELSK
jgi:predicted SAM-dependent methyltransferase